MPDVNWLTKKQDGCRLHNLTTQGAQTNLQIKRCTWCYSTGRVGDVKSCESDGGIGNKVEVGSVGREEDRLGNVITAQCGEEWCRTIGPVVNLSGNGCKDHFDMRSCS